MCTRRDVSHFPHSPILYSCLTCKVGSTKCPCTCAPSALQRGGHFTCRVVPAPATSAKRKAHPHCTWRIASVLARKTHDAAHSPTPDSDTTLRTLSGIFTSRLLLCFVYRLRWCRRPPRPLVSWNDHLLPTLPRSCSRPPFAQPLSQSAVIAQLQPGAFTGWQLSSLLLLAVAFSSTWPKPLCCSRYGSQSLD